MSHEEINSKIIDYLRKYHPEKIGVFGSHAREEENEESDLDILVSFRESFGLLTLVKMERELSELLGRKVDLLTEGALQNERIKKHIYKDLKIIYR